MKFKITPAVRQCVLLAYGDIIVEKDAHVWTNKSIRSLVEQHWSCNKSQVRSCGINKVVYVLQTLLKDGNFESEVQASKAQDNCKVNRDKAPDTALGKRNAALQRPVKTERKGRHNDLERQGRDTLSSMYLSNLLNRRSHKLIRVEDPEAMSIERIRACFALQPPQFPYETQHRILSTIQQLLERSCFNFVKQWLPSVLEKRKWNCAAAGELTEWLCILKEHTRDLPNGCISTGGQASLNKIARAVARLRHTVVHRLHLTSDEFLGQIHSALMLAGFLQDVRSTSTLQVLYGRVDAHAKKMDHDIEAVQQEINATLLQIQREREALAQREQKLQLYTAQQNIAIPNVTSLALLESIEAVLASSNSNVEVKEQIIGGHDKNAEHTYGVIVEDDDIESDEDHLRAELR